MFTKKVHADVKKSTLKVQDGRKDSATRFKHLRIVLENLDVEESRQFFESNFSHIYGIVYDSFIIAEINLRQRELSFHLVHKAHREELECVLQVLERILVLLPELLGRRWQCHSLTRIMMKLLHPGNSWKLRREAMRYFLLWYQTLGDMAPNAIHAMFATLVPGFPSPFPGLGLDSLVKSGSQGSTFHDTNHGQVSPVEILPIYPPQSGEKQPENLPCSFLEALLEFFVSQVGRIEWRDKPCKQHESFLFLFERFKQYYLPHIFPDFSYSTSLYKPNLELPTLRRASDGPDGRRRVDPMISCRVAFIKWVANFTHSMRKGETSFTSSVPTSRCVPVSSHSQSHLQAHPHYSLHTNPQSHASSHLSSSASTQASSHGCVLASSQSSAQSLSLVSNEESDRIANTELRRVSVSHVGISNSDAVSPDSNHSISFSQNDYSSSEDPNQSAISLVREVLYSSRDNVNLVHEVYRQAFLLDMSQAAAIRRTIAVYKDWIQMKVDLPPFLLEPLESQRSDDCRPSTCHSSLSDPSSTDHFETHRLTRLRNDSYLGAIHRENLLVRAGLQNLLQVFITHAAHVFTLEVTPDFPVLLEEQVEACKRVLNIYRYMVMHTRMEAKTWEQLLVVLLQVTSLILSRTPPKRKEETLGGKLAPAIFQTLIVTWIKANLNVVIPSRLWDQFLTVLTSLTQWEELIREWAKTLETLTRVLARHVYNLDLNDLPLDRLTEQKAKRHRGRAVGNAGDLSSGSFPNNDSARGNNSSSVDSGKMSGVIAPRRSKDRIMTTSNGKHSNCQADDQYNGPNSFANSDAGAAIFHFSNRQINHRKRFDSSSECNLTRSASETTLSAVKTGHSHHSPHARTHSSRPGAHANTIGIPVLPQSVEAEVARLLAQPETKFRPQNRPFKRRSRSMDSLKTGRGTSLLHLCESECPTRSPSPAPSSGLESNSFKDSPMQIDVIGGDGTSLDIADGEGCVEQRSVMAGGTERGWLPDVAVVLWRRMLGALGDINRLVDPALHEQVFNYLVELNDTMVKIRLNQGVSVDNQVTPPPPDLVPPITIIAPWCFQALKLPDSYQKGKLSACRLLCSMTVASHDIPLSRDHITQFYNVLHHGLIGTDQLIMNSLVKFCGPRFFSLQLPGYSLLLLDFIHAANSIVSTSDLRHTPRTEAMSILGTLLSLTNSMSSFPVLQPNAVDYSIMSCVDAKDHIVNILLKCGKREPAGAARCIALSSLGIYLYQELSNPPNTAGQHTFHTKMRDAINVLLLALRFNHRTVAQVASDIVLLLVDHVTILLEFFPDVPPRIVEVITCTLAQLTPQEGVSISERDKRLLTSLLFCLGEWVMALPKQVLLTPWQLRSQSRAQADGFSLLHNVFKVLMGLSGSGSSADFNTPDALFTPDLMQEFEPSISLDNLREGTSGGGVGARRSSAMPPETYAHRQPCCATVRLAAKTVLMHLLNHVGHFPMAIGAARLSSMVVEHDDVPGLPSDELSVHVFSAPNIQLLVLSSQRLLSLVELPALEVPGGGVTAGLITARSQVRLLLRDLSGKACWDASTLYCSPENCMDSSIKCWTLSSDKSAPAISSVMPTTPTSSTLPRRPYSIPIHSKMEESLLSSCLVSNTAPQHTLRHRPPHILPTVHNTAADMDNLDDLLQYIGHTSPECLESLDTPRNLPSAPPPPLFAELEQEVITCLLSQRFNEQEHIQRYHSHATMLGEWAQRPQHRPPASPFQHCRLLFSQLGLAGWERRSQLNLLFKNEKLLRELRNLDSQRCRETHKIAVIYVAEGQEDKNSILSNTSGSQAYEEFIAGLAWEVELESHTGFLGGLQRNKSTGDTAPYFATSFLEVIFHVATRMPSCSQESLLQKTRHLGNDEVHIVWSEHSRDYRRGIIPTEFCDVLVVIYPLPNKLFRVQVSRKAEVPYFGPLFNESIVDQRVLPGLVRATAISASRAMRSLLPFYQQFYEDRAKSLDTIVKNHKDASTYEEFTAQVFSPAPGISSLYSGPNRSSGTGERDEQCGHSSQLAAALIDSHRHASRRSSSAGLQEVPLGKGGEVDAIHGISPRPFKKVPLKLNPRSSKNLGGGSSLTPPDSPTSRKSK